MEIFFFLGISILFKFLFPEIAFKLYLSLNKWLWHIIIILHDSSFLLISYCDWTLRNRRENLFYILLFNRCKMTLSNIVLIIRSKRLTALISFLLLRGWDFEIFIVILCNIRVLWINVANNRLVQLVFVHQTEFMVFSLILVWVVLDWRLRLGLSDCFQSVIVVRLFFVYLRILLLLD